jgi:hypothetical protein
LFEIPFFLIEKLNHYPGKAMDDGITKTLFQMRNTHVNLFLAGSKKQVAKRKGEAALNEQYYKIKF